MFVFIYFLAAVIYLAFFTEFDFESVDRRFESCRAYQEISNGVERMLIPRFLSRTQLFGPAVEALPAFE